MHSESFIYQSETEVLEAAAGFIKERFKRSETFTSALDAQHFLNLRFGLSRKKNLCGFVLRFTAQAD